MASINHLNSIKTAPGEYGKLCGVTGVRVRMSWFILVFTFIIMQGLSERHVRRMAESFSDLIIRYKCSNNKRIGG